MSSEEGAMLESNLNNDSEANELMLQSNSSESCSKPTDSSKASENPVIQRRHIPSASSALVIGAILGLVQAIFLISLAKPLLNFMGMKPAILANAFAKNDFDRATSTATVGFRVGFVAQTFRCCCSGILEFLKTLIFELYLYLVRNVSC